MHPAVEDSIIGQLQKCANTVLLYVLVFRLQVFKNRARLLSQFGYGNPVSTNLVFWRPF